MGKIIAVVLGLALIAFAAMKALEGTRTSNPEAEAIGSTPTPTSAGSERSAPARQLDNVREAAKRIEVQGQQRADEAAQPTE